MKAYFLVILVLISNITLSNAAKIDNGTKYAIYDIGFNGLAGGIGSMIHKSNKETYIHAFVNGFWKGCIGGGINVGAKYTIRQIAIKETYNYAWPAHILSSIGSSITTNAFWNKGIIEEYSLDIGFIRVTTNWKEVKSRLMPVSLVSTIVFASKYDINVERTLKSGYYSFDYPMNFDKINGINYANNNSIRDYGFSKNGYETEYSIFSHELIHTIQFNEYLSINIFKNYTKFIYLDIPIYKIASIGKYYNMPNEKEAIFYTNKK